MAGLIPEDFISDLIARSDIVQVISRSVPLKKAGREFRACCPFHQEKTPSFYVNPTKQFYHCFGCGKSGTVVSFLMDYSNLSFREAIEELADHAGVKVPAGSNPSRGDGDYQKMLDLMQEVQRAYQHELMREESGEKARSYLKSRGLSHETAKKFGLGYAPAGWDFVLSRFGGSEESDRLLVKTGMVKAKEEGRKLYDGFRDRLMFPITDNRGRVIAFGGRVIDEGEPKYLNSPDTPLFRKGRVVFGLEHARNAIRQAEKALVVEGYTDVIALAQHGVEYAVAALGTAMTPDHVRELFKQTAHVVFCFDGDSAGRTAAERALDACLPMMHDGRLASFMFLPQGQDPDTFVREEGAKGFEEQIADAIPIAEFVFNTLCEKCDVERVDGRAQLIEEFRPIFEKLPDNALSAMMLGQVANFVELDAEFLKSRLTAGGQKADRHASRRDVQPKELPAFDLVSRTLAVLAQNPEIGKEIAHPDSLAESSDERIRLISDIALVIDEQESEVNSAWLLEKFRDSEMHGYLSEMVALEHKIPMENIGQSYGGMVKSLEERVVRQKYLDSIAQPDTQSEEDGKRFQQIHNDMAAFKQEPQSHLVH